MLVESMTATGPLAVVSVGVGGVADPPGPRVTLPNP
jgi:hypothetical protein